MAKKRYRSIYDALDAVLMGGMDTSGVKTAKERLEERKREPEKTYATLENALDPNADKLRKLKAIMDDERAPQGERDNARRLYNKIKNRG